jgi:hypothetical protein
MAKESPEPQPVEQNGAPGTTRAASSCAAGRRTSWRCLLGKQVCQQQLDQHGRREPGERVGDGDHGHLIPAHPAPDGVPAPCPRPAAGPPRRTRTIITALPATAGPRHPTAATAAVPRLRPVDHRDPGRLPDVRDQHQLPAVAHPEARAFVRHSPAGRAGGPPPGRDTSVDLISRTRVDQGSGTASPPGRSSNIGLRYNLASAGCPRRRVRRLSE